MGFNSGFKGLINKFVFTSKLDLKLRKKLVKSYVWSIDVCGDETWTVRKEDQEYLESHQQIGLKFEEETNKVLCLERSCVW